ncbi:hypothetical protein JCM10049v2_001358 [Rhodotorula toruloides]
MLLSSFVPAVALACFALAVPVDEAVTPVTDVSKTKSFLVQAPQSFSLSKRQGSNSGNNNNGGTRYCDRRGRCCGRCSFAQDFDMTEFDGLDEPEDKVPHKDKAAVVVNEADLKTGKASTPAIKNVNEVVEKDAAAKDSKVNSKANSKESHVAADVGVQDVVERDEYDYDHGGRDDDHDHGHGHGGDGYGHGHDGGDDDGHGHDGDRDHGGYGHGGDGYGHGHGGGYGGGGYGRGEGHDGGSWNE